MSTRSGHYWYLGPPGSFTASDLTRLSGRYVSCPDCATLETCHLHAIISNFKTAHPNLPPPRFMSLKTKDLAIIKDVLLQHDAVYCGCGPPPLIPITRELGVTLSASKFGDPKKMEAILASREKAKATRQARKGVGKKKKKSKIEFATVEVRDLAPFDADEHDNCFANAWRQQREREKLQQERS